jgi:hypothetical protein
MSWNHNIIMHPWSPATMPQPFVCGLLGIVMGLCCKVITEAILAEEKHECHICGAGCSAPFYTQLVLTDDYQHA